LPRLYRAIKYLLARVREWLSGKPRLTAESENNARIS
jgi:hypothetical protein